MAKAAVEESVRSQEYIMILPEYLLNLLTCVLGSQSFAFNHWSSTLKPHQEIKIWLSGKAQGVCHLCRMREGAAGLGKVEGDAYWAEAVPHGGSRTRLLSSISCRPEVGSRLGFILMSADSGECY